MIQAVFLKHRINLAVQLAQMHAEEWQYLYRDWNAAAAVREFEMQKGDGGLPTTLVALEGDDLRGSISLVFDDLPGVVGLNPWVASMYVLPRYRGQGVGASLLGQACAMLERNGVRQAYLFTEKAQGYFRKHGWSLLKPATANGVAVDIMTRLFGAGTGEGA
ncbi:MAG: GNAT family N-acetyltransferase [Kiritimatiellae bacterium]|nr:GNAT family N-acetyltransferase [Kiritimatiellia bacterium]